MDPDTDIPDEVIAEIAAGRKINAIKLLRKHRGIDLKEAKEIVDSYAEANPAKSAPREPQTDTGIGRIIILVIGVSVIYGIYKYFG